jgi:hypothetical protein
MSRIDLARQYMQHQRDQNFDAALAMLADDVVVSNPMTGTMTGKPAVEQGMRNRPAGAAGGITWGEPAEEGNMVKVIGAGSPFGDIKIEISFNPDDKINKIDIGLA